MLWVLAGLLVSVKCSHMCEHTMLEALLFFLDHSIIVALFIRKLLNLSDMPFICSRFYLLK